MTSLTPSPQKPSSHELEELVASRRQGYGLPGRFYRDAGLYAYEWDAIWRKGWIFVGHTCQVAQPGDFFTVTLDTDSLIILREDEEHIRAFHNICTHRGMLLTEQASGSIC